MKQPVFTGAAVAIITPMHADGTVNFEELGRIIDDQIAHGTDAIVICGTTGESAALSHEEHVECIRFAVKHTAKRVPVIAGTGSNDTAFAIEISKEAEEAGADGIALINTMMGMRIDLKTKKPVIANKMGGFSGSAIFPVAVRMVYQVAEAVNIPVIGMGGVSSAEDVIEMMLAGATAVEIGAANLVDPFICKKIIEDLPRVMEKYNIKDLNDIIGGAHK